MPTTSTKISTRASNALKHPGIPDQTKKKRSPAEMATLRASEKAANDAKAAADLAAPSIIAHIEDNMAAADKDDEQNAAHPIPADIPRVLRPIRRTHTFANLEQDDDVEEGRAHDEGRSSVISASPCPLLNTG
jgi:hypothetical protein